RCVRIPARASRALRSSLHFGPLFVLVKRPKAPKRHMKIFLDTADVPTIRELAATGLVDGITTNPSLAAKTGRPFFEALKEICDLVPGPISAEVTALESAAMIDEGKKLARVAPNVTVKVPLTWD